jgi:hypothetical protein
MDAASNSRYFFPFSGTSDGARARSTTFDLPVHPGIGRTADAAGGTLAVFVDTNEIFKVTLYDAEP